MFVAIVLANDGLPLAPRIMFVYLRTISGGGLRLSAIVWCPYPD